MAKEKSQTAQTEEEILKLWKKEQTFEESLKQREGSEVFSFYDGPPFANGLPHFGHSLVTSIKDALGRYKTMRGYYVERRNGWDCHGLPVEFAIEKQFGISGKKQIMELGLDKFNTACRDSVFMYKSEWEGFFERIGRWTDTENAYATIDRDYTESVWWVLSEIHKKGLLYRGYKSMPYCPRCETPLSNFEVNEGYRDDVPDPSLYMKFKLKGEDAYLLGWTTTPWSLPGNAAVAVNPDEQYVYVKYHDDEGEEHIVVLAKKRLETLGKQDYSIVKEVSGMDLVGKSYEPLFVLEGLDSYTGHEKLYKVWPAHFVSVEDGTGVLHVAPAFGEDDLNLSEKEGLPVLQTVDASGHIKGGIGFDDIAGKFFKGADKHIIEHLTKRGAVFAAEIFEHTYPFCYRCDSPLLYYAISTWFVKVTAVKDKLLKSADRIEWTPEHIKTGRFGKWLEGARDWAISRNRYWGAPMPIWVNEDDESDYIVVGSTAELLELTDGKAKLDDLHRPFIDEVTITRDGKTYRRIEEVLDCWFESGSMPYAQQHFPFENKDKFAVSFPADYIGEGLDQTRLWFYVLHVIATILFEKPAYKHVLVNGMILAADGQKLSKRLKNYPPVEDVFATEGADTLRLYLLSNNQAVSADYMRFNRDAMKDLSRNVLGTLQNSFRFFKMYADIDKWQAPASLEMPESESVLDQWILARLNETIGVVTEKADEFKLAHAINPIFDLIDDTSNWYIRRSRRRFWKSDDDGDKQSAYHTLWYVLTVTTQLLAPWAPFLSDKLWRELTKGAGLPQSVHLSDWPKAETFDDVLLSDMQKARAYINEGLSQRAEAKVKVRQPLRLVTVPKVNPALVDIIKDELNVKKLAWGSAGKVKLDVTVDQELKDEGVARDIIRHVQSARKKAGLDVANRIKLSLASDNKDFLRAIKRHEDVIKSETLATQLTQESADYTYTDTVKIEGVSVQLSLERIKE